MNSVERVKKLCKKNKIPISKLERDLGFSNGYIGQLRKGVFPDDRLAKIAEYFGVSVDYLMTGEEKENYYINPETAKIAQEVFEDPELRILFDASRDLSPEDLQAVITMVKALQRKEKGEDEF